MGLKQEKGILIKTKVLEREEWKPIGRNCREATERFRQYTDVCQERAV